MCSSSSLSYVYSSYQIRCAYYIFTLIESLCFVSPSMYPVKSSCKIVFARFAEIITIVCCKRTVNVFWAVSCVAVKMKLQEREGRYDWTNNYHQNAFMIEITLIYLQETLILRRVWYRFGLKFVLQNLFQDCKNNIWHITRMP